MHATLNPNAPKPQTYAKLSFWGEDNAVSAATKMREDFPQAIVKQNRENVFFPKTIPTDYRQDIAAKFDARG